MLFSRIFQSLFHDFFIVVAKPPASPVADDSEQPTNLLVTFLEYSSIALQDVRGKFFYLSKLSPVIVMCDVNLFSLNHFLYH